jgi:hypothetical protein
VLIRIAIAFALLVAACSGGTAEPAVTTAISSTQAPVATGQVDSDGRAIPVAPEAPTGPLDEATIAAVEAVWSALFTQVDPADVAELGSAGDARLGWLLSDLLRFFQGGTVGDAATTAFTELTGVAPPVADDVSPWQAVTDLMIAWDLDAPPGYADYKARLFTLVDVGWEPFFNDTRADVDWRFVSWGGVLIDNRELGDRDPCPRGCIPAIDDPLVTPAAAGDWYRDDAVVFGVTINGESRAYPKNIMEVHEMINDTVGGRRIGMPYCTLCGSAQAFHTDVVPDGFSTLVLRTSGLLARSNKVMYDLENQSMFDTFRGVALTGPLREAGFELEPVTVVTTTWGEWKTAHPETTIVAQDGGLGRVYPDDPLRGRDDNGPIFPVGDVDPRLAVQEPVVGVVATDGTVVAFPAAAARTALNAGSSVSAGGIELRLDGGGLRAFEAAGDELPTHESFWFAWSQFQPDTAVWQP